MRDMIKITISENQSNQRLDRFLKKYLEKGSLSYIYKLIRKDVKVNGKRKPPETVLAVGDEISLYISEEQAASMQKEHKKSGAKKQFSVIYEDDKILVVEKPFGLLTHGDSHEKKNHLANQVIDYLIEKGEYNPRIEKTFVPSPANRLDRNTTGLVIFGKTAPALQELNRMIRERDGIDKVYLTIVAGSVPRSLNLKDTMVKNGDKNMVTITTGKTGGVAENSDEKSMETDIAPLKTCNGYTLAEAKIHTGRTHQIRVQLAGAGFPIIGDNKYGNSKTNELMKKKYGLTTQLLHAYRLRLDGCSDDGPLAYLQGKEFTCPLPDRFQRIKKDIFG